jgi:hypothetical protein
VSVVDLLAKLKAATGSLAAKEPVSPVKKAAGLQRGAKFKGKDLDSFVLRFEAHKNEKRISWWKRKYSKK